MQNFNTDKIVYLEDTDFPNNYLASDITNRYTNKPYFSGTTIVMIQGNFCGYCTKMKPLFQQLAENHCNEIDFATVETDGSREGQQKLKSILPQVLGFEIEGVPAIVKFKNGKYVETFKGGRTLSELEKFI
jgi:thiol-disulfide isomerase/thioredoxin